MSGLESVISKYKEELQLQEEKYKTLLQEQVAKYKKLDDYLSEIQGVNADKRECILKQINELLTYKNALHKILNNEECSPGLPLSLQTQELFLKFISSSTNDINKASTIISSLQKSTHDNYSDICQDINLYPQHAKQIFNDVRKSYELATNLLNNKDIINQNKNLHNLMDDNNLESVIDSE